MDDETRRDLRTRLSTRERGGRDDDPELLPVDRSWMVRCSEVVASRPTLALSVYVQVSCHT